MMSTARPDRYAQARCGGMIGSAADWPASCRNRPDRKLH